MFGFARYLVLAVAMSPTLASRALAQAPGAQISGVTYAGSGCPAGSAAVSLSPDGQAVTALFSAFVASSDAASPRGGRRIECDLRLTMQTPLGWSFALIGVTFRGHAELEAGAIGIQDARYRFLGARVYSELPTVRLNGPMADDYQQSALVGAATPWSPCSRTPQQSIQLQTTLLVAGRPVTGGVARGTLSLDALDGQVMQNYRVAWRSCRGR